MKLIALFGLIAGATLALGRLTSGQWRAIGMALLALTVRYGLTVLPWLLAALFCLLWLRQRDITRAFREGYLEKIMNPTVRKRARSRMK